MVVAVLLISTLGYVGWSSLSAMVAQRADAEAASCPAGDQTLRIAVEDAMAEPLIDSAQAWSAERPVIQDACIRVEVVAHDSSEVLAGLTGEWNEGELGPRPNAWVPDSLRWVQQLTEQQGDLIGSQPQILATSPVLLAMTEPAADAVRMHGGMSWTDLASLVEDPQGWSRFEEPAWGQFRLVLPDPATNPTTGLALQGLLAGENGTGPLTSEALAEESTQDALRQLWQNEPLEVPASTHDALVELGAATEPGIEGFHATPVSEVDLYRRNLGLDGERAPGTPIAGFMPGGANPSVEYPLVAINGGADDSTLSRATQQFGEFLRHRDQQRGMAEAGFRVTAVMYYPNPAPGVRWSTPDANLTAADGATTQELIDSWHGQAAS
ncbi:substrate-binding domain-containing protein [Actinoalloteichus hymeniacidonis]|uniref:Bacterial extracellular solute-binding protein n=1 Tax=Actinoalloteichus hymeniacidonis TaxID=340345 RepID=A0AAC9MY66_9PSEU|nr:substrate-binding domain-containing protein [Actinoalloteichus hymeniacidonis]AOS62970.1 Bacterial extracellular solute-binding protein [Actinoalloteichus hymeniacidonis]MBB5908995.1 Holliday junction resolvase-like predicted endonuclease [Actinoalloteichus hymeniacidonis]